MQNSLDFINQLAKGFAEIKRIPDIQYQYNPRELVYEYDKLKLYHYRSKSKKQTSTPLLVVFATVNRPEILDLFPEHSFISGLLENNMDVYLLDWGYPDEDDEDVSLGDYVVNYLHQCVKFICEQSRRKKINLLGICQGGLLCLCHTILFQHIKNLVLISTPIDFHTRDNMITRYLKNLDVASFASMTGTVSGEWLTHFFILMRPFELIGKKYLRFVDNVSNQEWTDHFLQVEKWLNDAPDQTGASFFELVKELYQGNKLIKGEFYLMGQKIDLSKLSIPVLNVMAKEDEIVPMSASRALKKYIASSDYSERVFSSGHIGIYISDRVGKRMPKAIAHWLKKRE